ncbi:hypothetical protein L6E12_01690 [Actinokineospora sp. PR83]|uniref:hypothetical protein n=1 Tax=Actinokineospora sp. PR83 TaxID=2884908 RepID=UPI001F38DFEC|nr:hypothetical protein [Actinokineospora sp. PR83]MCG8914507.1 hypothetical protein [Actinokineospora sp. PR83]
MSADHRGDGRTFRPRFVIALACHNQNTVHRLLEVQDLFRSDPRFGFVYALSDTSRFRDGVERLLRGAGVTRIVPWSALPEQEYRLLLTASEHIDFTTTRGPVVLLPHGVGFNKRFVDGELAGLPPVAVLREGRVHVVLSHPDQVAQLLAECPEAAGHLVVTGDTTFDRLVASLPLRARYRRRLGVGDERLVVVASTWGVDAAVGRRPELPMRLLAELPYDRYRVCLVAHPNLWAAHGGRDLEVLFADELDAGMLLLPPDSGWHAALVAADVVVTDHGSLSLYAAGLGKPLLLTDLSAEIEPGTPVADLQHLTPRLDATADLRTQIDNALPPEDHRALAERVFANQGGAHERLQDLVYRLLETAPSRPPVLHRAPDPAPVAHRLAAALRVRTAAAGNDISVERRPAQAQPPREGWHLAVEEGASDLRLTQKASILCREDPADEAQAVAWASSALAAYPGARIAAAAVAGGAVVVVRGGQLVRATSTAAVSVIGPVVHHLLLAGRLADGEHTADTGARRDRLGLRVSPGQPTGL